MKQVRDLVILASGRALQVLAAFVTIRALTSLLSAREVGRTYLLLSIVSWFNLSFINPVWTYTARKLLEWNRHGIGRQRLMSFVKYVIIVVGGAVPVLLIVKWIIGIGTAIDTLWLLSLVAGMVLCGGLSSGFVTGLNILGRRMFFVALTNAALWVGVVISIAGVLSISASAEYWMAGQLAGQAAVLLLAGLMIWRTLGGQGPSQERAHAHDNSFRPRVVFRFSWPLAVAVGLYWMQSQGYRFVLLRLTGEESVGLFSAGYSVGATPIVAFENLFSQFYHPIFYGAIAHKGVQERAKAWNEYASAFIPAVILTGACVALSAPFLVKVMAGETFQGVARLVVWASVTESVRLVSSTYYMAALAQLDMRSQIQPTAIGGVMALAGVPLFSAMWNPLDGTGLALSLAAVGVVVRVGQKLRRELPIVLPWHRMARAFGLALPLLAFLGGIRWVVPHPTVEEAVVVLILAGGYMLLGQYSLARTWLYKESVIGRERGAEMAVRGDVPGI